MVDWALARRVAALAAPPEPEGAPPDGTALRDLARGLEPAVAAYTRLRPGDPVPAVEAVGRAEWAAVNLEGMRDMLAPVTARLENRMEAKGPLAGPLKLVAGATLATEAGLVMGYMSRRVLGQYEVSLLQAPGDAPSRLLLVSANIESAAREMEVEHDPFLTWIVLHELTHAFQFAGVPWLRGHLGELLREYLATVEVRMERGAAGAAAPGMPGLERLVDAFREGGLVSLVQTEEQRALMGRIQGAMAVVEGYAEHVMDAIAPGLVPAHEELRAAMQRRRGGRSAPERILQRLLGFDLKMRQYEIGREFCDAVVDRATIDGLNRVWSAPAALPSEEELRSPEKWLRRVDGLPRATN